MGMTLFRRTPPPDPAQVAAARAAELAAEVDRQRALDQLARDRADATRADARAAKVEAEAERKRRREQAAARRSQRYARLVVLLATIRTVAPLLLVNTATVGGQFVYAYAETPETWASPLRAVCAGIYALAAETIALYVGWHAHDALLQGAHATAGRLRRASYAIAAVVGVLNYSHFSDNLEPTAFGVALGVLSLLSPWLWGLHTRRAQHVQLLAEDASLIDKAGAEFSAERRRAFPVRSWQARRWSIEHNVRDPKAAWDGYNRERRHRLAHRPTGRIRAAVTVLRGRPVPGTPAAIVAAPMEPDVREMLAEIRGQARDARRVVTVGAHQFLRTADRQPDRHGDGLDTVMLAVAEPVTMTALPASPRPSAGPQPDRQPGAHRDGQVAAKRTTRKTVTETVNPNAAKVRRAAAKLGPNATAAEVAKRARVSESTARRYMPPKDN